MIYISMFTPTQRIMRGRRAFTFPNNFALMGIVSLGDTRPMMGVTPAWACHHRKGHPSGKKGGGPSGCAPPAI